jgi:PiT family inorganic phosphate transporter
MAASLNFLGALYSTGVAKTVAQDIISIQAATSQVMIAALLGAISWNLLTWYLVSPRSSQALSANHGAGVTDAGLPA